MLIINYHGGVFFMFKLEITDWDVYYLHNYIRNDDRRVANLNDRKLSSKILNYKNGKTPEIRLFTRELMKSISYISNYIIGDKFEKLALVSIPPSKVDKFSPILESINQIEEWYKIGKTRSDFDCSYEIINANILTRYSNVNSAHNEGQRPTYDEHLNSILYDKNFIFEKNTAFILIDDITTTGTIMDACEDILTENDIDKNSIYKLAISKTVHDDD